MRVAEQQSSYREAKHPVVAQSTKLGALESQSGAKGMNGGFWERHWSSVYIGSLETLVWILAKAAAAAAAALTGQINSEIQGKTKGPFISVLLPEGAIHFR